MAAAVFSRRILPARGLPKLRVYLTGKEFSCCVVPNFYCVGYSNRIDNRTNNFLQNVRLEPRWLTVRHFSEDSSKQTQPAQKEKAEEKKLSLFQRFKDMYKKYWYVLVPVHLITSAFWVGGFYYLATSGVDIISIMESLNFSETLVKPFRDSSMGYVAVTYGLYKIATPLRYTVTLGGTTVSINYLKKWGYIKPVPSTEELKEMYKEKKENLMDSVRERREGFWHTTDKLRGKRDDLFDDIIDKKESLEKNLMDKKQTLEKSLKDTQSKILHKKDEVFRLKNHKN